MAACIWTLWRLEIIEVSLMMLLKSFIFHRISQCNGRIAAFFLTYYSHENERIIFGIVPVEFTFEN